MKLAQSEADFMGLTLVFPWPDSRLNPNSRKRHWWAKAATTKEAREQARIIAWGTRQAWSQAQHDVTSTDIMLTAHCPMFPWEHCQAHITWYPPTGRRRDFGNLLAALKPTFDGIVDAGILTDDSAEHLTIGCLELAKPDAVKPRVEIVLERVQ